MSNRYENYQAENGIEATRAKVARDAMDVQDACNMRGVMLTQWDAACYLGRSGSLTPEQAPELVLYASKIASLLGVEGPTLSEFARAWERCEERARVPVTF